MSSSKRLALKTKLLFYNIFLSTFLLVSGSIGYFGLKNSAAKYEHIIAINDKVTESLQHLDAAKSTVVTDLYRMANPALAYEERVKIDERLKDEVAQFTKALEEYRGIKHDIDDSSLIEPVVDAWKATAVTAQKIMELAHLKNEEAVQEFQVLLKGDLEKNAEALDQALLRLEKFHDENADKGVAEAQSTGHFANTLAALAILVALVVFIASGLYIGQSISKQISRIAERLATTSNEVLGESVKVSAASSQLASAMTEQASAIQETVAAVDEISAMVAKTTDSSQQSQKDADLMNQVAGTGKESLNRVVTSIGEIADGNNQLLNQIEVGNTQLEKIVSLITEIGTKTKVINDIVFQTKLLSFNASVEAARAGEHGKGFAVVAEEVGNLAQMSGNASKEISDMLEQSTSEVKRIVSESKGSVTAMMDRTRAKLSEGKNVAQECAQVFDQIIEQASAVNKNINDIAVASKEQSAGIGEINRVMNGLGEVTQQNSTTTNETAHAASELKRQAEEAKRAVSELMGLVSGRVNAEALPEENMKKTTAPKVEKRTETPAKEKEPAKVVSLVDTRKSLRTTPSGMTSHAVGAEIPNADDERFEKI